MPQKFHRLLLPAFALLFSCHSGHHHSSAGWPVYRGDKTSTAWSALDEINTGNVSRLEPAWIFHCGDAREANRSAIQCNPIIADGRMYVTSPRLKLIALDPAIGRELWRFDPFAGGQATGVNRGVTYWQHEDDKRIFFSAGPYLYALNAADGKTITTFGDQGKVDLRMGLDRPWEKLSVWATSPGIIYKDLLIQGTALGEGYDAAPGFIRAYDVRTGRIAWTFHTIPQPGEFGYDTWDTASYKEVGGVNCWAGMSLDERRGIVYIPLGSPAFDFYGGNRKGSDLFGNCLLALDAATGKRKWHYQLVHHDLWDYDLPAPPVLVTLKDDTGTIDAVAQITKMGMVFVLDRTTGRPLFPVDERPVPHSTLPGETASPTQPFPILPKPFVRQTFSTSDITDISDSAHRFVSDKIGRFDNGTIFTPPDTAGVVEFPGTRGGAEWGGASFDPSTGILYVNANEIPFLVKMMPVSVFDKGAHASEGEKIYTLNNCTMCHGADRKGSDVYPSLLNLSEKYTAADLDNILAKGRGQMPAFSNITTDDRKNLIDFLLNKKSSAPSRQSMTRNNAKYVHNGWIPLTDQEGYPGVKPPWGTLNAIDLNSGELRWHTVLGEYPVLKQRGIKPTGTPNLGGSIVTAGGLLIIAAAADEKLRIFDKMSGKLLWEYQLPAGGYATPSTYIADGKQYIVIAAGGGGKVGTRSGDTYMAFRLKDK